MIPRTKRRRYSHKYAIIVILLLLLSGLFLIALPKIIEYKHDQQQLKLLTEWGQTQQTETKPESHWPDTTMNESSSTLPVSLLSTTDEPEPSKPEWATIDGVQILGTVTNEAIGLEEPIVRGTTEDSLLRGSGTVVEGRMPGELSNFVVAGHRSLTYGRHFNRLNELAEGDILTVNTSAGPYKYVVYDIVIVEPDNLSVLDNEQDQATLTLITCHPYRKATHRLIVKAKLFDTF